MKLSVVIVSFNVRYYLEQCLHSLTKALKGIDADVYVVDNHSHDDTLAMLQARYPNVHIIANKHNQGFARANNIAIQQSEADYVLLLNPDTVVAEGTLAHCISFMDSHPEAGALGVKMLNTNGQKARESRRGLPDPLTAFYKMSGLCSIFPKSHTFGHYYMGYLPWNEPAQIEIISGAFCFLRRKALLEVGLLDEDFFMYGEDIDLSYRILKGGWKNYYLPVTILHYKGESTQKSSYRYVHVFYEAMLIFFKKHYSHISLLLSLPIKCAIYAKASVSLCHMLSVKARRAVGLNSRHKAHRQPSFFFVGQEEALSTAKEILKRCGLRVAAAATRSANLPLGHQAIEDNIAQADDCYVIYDTNTYSYQQILSFMECHPISNGQVGFLYPDRKIIITPEEIYQ